MKLLAIFCLPSSANSLRKLLAGILRVVPFQLLLLLNLHLLASMMHNFHKHCSFDERGISAMKPLWFLHIRFDVERKKVSVLFFSAEQNKIYRHIFRNLFGRLYIKRCCYTRPHESTVIFWSSFSSDIFSVVKLKFIFQLFERVFSLFYFRFSLFLCVCVCVVKILLV